MPRYKYAAVVTGFMEAPDEQTARRATLAGITLVGSLLATRPDLAIEVGLVSDGQIPPNVTPFSEQTPRQGH